MATPGPESWTRLSSPRSSSPETRRRRPWLFGSNPRINFSRLGCVGWTLLIALIGAGAWFWRYTLGGVYTALATAAYHSARVMDTAFSAERFPQYPWVGWVLAGAIVGATLGFFIIAPVYGMRRGRWALLLVAIAIVAAISVAPSPAVDGATAPVVPDTMGPYVRTGGTIRAERGDRVLFRFLVRDQSPSADVKIVITDRETGRRVLTIDVGKVKTGAWHQEPYRCRLKPGAYTYTVRAIDPHGNPAVHEGQGKLRVRPRS